MGPTAGGKSAFALEVAEAFGGEIVNADAMQVYEGLRVLTARPSEVDEKRAPHHLYGYQPADARCSAGVWARDAAKNVREILARGRVPILVGGTGLYFRALEGGLSEIPDVPDPIRSAARARHEALGPEAFRNEVVSRDPEMARLPPGDTQRLLRAWEVFEATETPLSQWQAVRGERLVDGAVRRLVLAPDRAELYGRIDARVDQMMASGAIEEVETLLARGLPEDRPILKALGVREIAAFLRGEMDLNLAVSQMKTQTRRFAKRQYTWFRGQASDWARAATLSEARDWLDERGAETPPAK